MSERLTRNSKFSFYNQDNLDAMYDKLAELEDIMEKYGIENVEELDKTFEYVNKIINAYKTGSWKKEKQELEIDRDTWKRACELACKEVPLHCPNPPEYYDASKEYGCESPYYIQESACELADDIHECQKCQVDYFYEKAKKELTNE